METCSVCRRQKLVQLIQAGVSKAEAARHCGIPRQKVDKWLARFESGGIEALSDASSAPRRVHRFEGELAERIVELRRERPTWGPRKLIAWFERNTDYEMPAASTVGELLKRRQLVIKREPSARRYAPFRYAGPTPTEPCERWTMDFKGHFALQDGIRCHPFTLRDAASRKLLAIKALPSTHSSPVQSELMRCFEEHGLPQEAQSDGGAPFATGGLACLSALSVLLLKLDIVPVLSRPAKPQDNGGHERMHRDLKAETTRPPAITMLGQQRKFDRFLRLFNEERPHEALDGDVPDEHWKPSSRLLPRRIQEPEYPGWWEVRRVNRAANTISWNDTPVKVNDALAGEDIAFEAIDDDLYRVHFYKFTIGLFDVRGDRPKFIDLPRDNGGLKNR
jgi:putative transposase